MSLFNRSSSAAAIVLAGAFAAAPAEAGRWRCGEIADNVTTFGVPAVLEAFARDNRELPSRLIPCLTRRGVPQPVLDAVRAASSPSSPQHELTWVDLPEVEGADALLRALQARFGDSKPWAVWFPSDVDDTDWPDWAFDGAQLMWTALLRGLPADSANVTSIEALDAAGGADRLLFDPPWRPGDLHGATGTAAERHEAERALRRAGYRRLLEVRAQAEPPLGLRVQLIAWRLEPSGRVDDGTAEVLLLPNGLAQDLAVQRKGRQVVLKAPGGGSLAGWHLSVWHDGVLHTEHTVSDPDLTLKPPPDANLSVYAVQGERIARAALPAKRAARSPAKDDEPPQQPARPPTAADSPWTATPPPEAASAPAQGAPQTTPEAEPRPDKHTKRREDRAHERAARQAYRLGKRRERIAERTAKVEASPWLRPYWFAVGAGINLGSTAPASRAAFTFTPLPSANEPEPSPITRPAGEVLSGSPVFTPKLQLHARVGAVRLQASLGSGVPLNYTQSTSDTGSVSLQGSGVAALGWAGGRFGMFAGWKMFYRQLHVLLPSGEGDPPTIPVPASARGTGSGPALIFDLRISGNEAPLRQTLVLTADYALPPLGSFGGDWQGFSATLGWALVF